MFVETNCVRCMGIPWVSGGNPVGIRGVSGGYPGGVVYKNCAECMDIKDKPNASVEKLS